MSAEPLQGRDEPPRRRLTDKERAERQAAAIEEYWRKAGHPGVGVSVIELPIDDGGVEHWTVRTSLRNGSPPS